VLKLHTASAFLHNYFDDLLLIPCALPPLLLMQRWLGLRQHDQPPTPAEIVIYLVVWSILFEIIGPRLIPWTVGDPWDIVAYVVGGALAGTWWGRRELARFLRAGPDEL